MKTTVLIVALAALGATAVLGSDTSNNTQPVQAQAGIKKVKKSKGLASEKSVVLTGSYIKQKVRRNGVVTNGSNPVYVLDRNAIELSGAGDLSQVLIRTGFRR